MHFYCIDAVRLHLVSAPVKQDLRAVRRVETEHRLVTAATDLFLEHGYVGTTLADVAEHAGLAARTVYIRFATKAELLQRCVSVAIAGDTDPTPLREREWMVQAMTASTLDARLHLMASVTAELMRRAGPLLRVAQQAAASEPTIAAAAQAGRDDTRRTLDAFWRGMGEDGLLPAGCDLDWLVETATLLAHADTYLLLVTTTGWDVDAYEAWLESSWRRLVASSTQ
jgi:AcrR family transcriptional regulator